MLLRLALLLSLASPLFADDGQQLFTMYCSACHGADGKGATGGTFPPLAGSPWVANEPDRAVKVLLKGLHGPVEILGKSYNLEMPPQGALLNDDQVSAILTYVRSAWGNQASAVSADQVKTIRASIAGRLDSWTAAEILKVHPLPLEKTALKNLISHTYEGDWQDLPDFSQLKAKNVEEEHDGILNVVDSGSKDLFAIDWEGSFEAPADGDYTFLLDADDAARVIIDGKEVVAVHGVGPMNGSRSKKGNVKLSQGSHKFRAEYMEYKGHEGLALAWKAPGGTAWHSLSNSKTEIHPPRDQLLIGSTDGRPLIFRNFIEGTTSRAIGVAFPGGLNLAYSADDCGPELLWTGNFVDASTKWYERGTLACPPAGEGVVKLTKSSPFSEAARFKGYKLDPAGNPTFSIQLGKRYVLDGWQPNDGNLIRKLSLSGDGAPVNVVLADHPLDNLTIIISSSSVNPEGSKTILRLTPGQPVTLTYTWKKP